MRLTGQKETDWSVFLFILFYNDKNHGFVRLQRRQCIVKGYLMLWIHIRNDALLICNGIEERCSLDLIEALYQSSQRKEEVCVDEMLEGMEV